MLYIPFILTLVSKSYTDKKRNGFHIVLKILVILNDWIAFYAVSAYNGGSNIEGL